MGWREGESRGHLDRQWVCVPAQKLKQTGILGGWYFSFEPFQRLWLSPQWSYMFQCSHFFSRPCLSPFPIINPDNHLWAGCLEHSPSLDLGWEAGGGPDHFWRLTDHRPGVLFIYCWLQDIRAWNNNHFIMLVTFWFKKSSRAWWKWFISFLQCSGPTR